MGSVADDRTPGASGRPVSSAGAVGFTAPIRPPAAQAAENEALPALASRGIPSLPIETPWSDTSSISPGYQHAITALELLHRGEATPRDVMDAWHGVIVEARDAFERPNVLRTRLAKGDREALREAREAVEHAMVGYFLAHRVGETLVAAKHAKNREEINTLTNDCRSRLSASTELAARLTAASLTGSTFAVLDPEGNTAYPTSNMSNERLSMGWRPHSDPDIFDRRLAEIAPGTGTLSEEQPDSYAPRSVPVHPIESANGECVQDDFSYGVTYLSNAIGGLRGLETDQTLHVYSAAAPLEELLRRRSHTGARERTNNELTEALLHLIDGLEPDALQEPVAPSAVSIPYVKGVAHTLNAQLDHEAGMFPWRNREGADLAFALTALAHTLISDGQRGRRQRTSRDEKD